MAIDHFSKWVEVKEVKGHDANTTREFLEREVLGRGFVPKTVLTDNGTEWQGEFKLLCEQNGIKHDHSGVYWPQGNGLVERFIQTLKRGLATMIAQHGGEWDEHLQQVLQGYRCSKQASTQMSPFFVMTGRHPRMVIENVLDPEWQSQDHLESVEFDTGGVMEKAITIFQANQQVLVNIEQAQARQQIQYTRRKNVATFARLEPGKTLVKMRIIGKRRTLDRNWEGPYEFVDYRSSVTTTSNLGGRICLLKDKNGQEWERPRRDIQEFHTCKDVGGTQHFER